MQQIPVAYNLTPLWEPAVILPARTIDRRLARMPERLLVAAIEMRR